MITRGRVERYQAVAEIEGLIKVLYRQHNNMIASFGKTRPGNFDSARFRQAALALGIPARQVTVYVEAIEGQQRVIAEAEKAVYEALLTLQVTLRSTLTSTS